MTSLPVQSTLDIQLRLWKIKLTSLTNSNLSFPSGVKLFWHITLHKLWGNDVDIEIRVHNEIHTVIHHYTA